MTTAPLSRWLFQESPLVGLCFLPWKNDGLSTFVFLSDREDSWNSIRGEAVQAACCLLRLIALIICLTQRWIYSSFQLPTKTLLYVYICVCCVKRGLEPATKRQRRKVILTSGLYFISTNWTHLPPNILYFSFKCEKVILAQWPKNVADSNMECLFPWWKLKSTNRLPECQKCIIGHIYINNKGMQFFMWPCLVTWVHLYSSGLCRLPESRRSVASPTFPTLFKGVQMFMFPSRHHQVNVWFMTKYLPN